MRFIPFSSGIAAKRWILFWNKATVPILFLRRTRVETPQKQETEQTAFEYLWLVP